MIFADPLWFTACRQVLTGGRTDPGRIGGLQKQCRCSGGGWPIKALPVQGAESFQSIPGLTEFSTSGKWTLDVAIPLDLTEARTRNSRALLPLLRHNFRGDHGRSLISSRNVLRINSPRREAFLKSVHAQPTLRKTPRFVQSGCNRAALLAGEHSKPTTWREMETIPPCCLWFNCHSETSGKLEDGRRATSTFAMRPSTFAVCMDQRDTQHPRPVH